MADLPEPVSDHQCVRKDDNVYLTGGTSQFSDAKNWTLKYDLKLDNWTILSSMSKARHSHAMVVMDNSLYVFGGRMGMSGNYTRTVEKLSNDDGQWKVVASELKGNFTGFAGVFQ